MRRKAVIVAGLGMLGFGCSQPELQPSFDSPHWEEQSARMQQVAEETEHRGLTPSEARGLISLLSSEDPAMRMFAIALLERSTGETFGYEYQAPETVREQSIDSWAEWYRTRFGEGLVGTGRAPTIPDHDAG